MSVPLLAPGSVLDGFEIVSLLGRGGMGAVYRARRQDTGEVAIKTLMGEVGVDEKLRFRRESDLLASLRHPSIVPCHGAGLSHGLLYFAMGLIEGESLEAKIRREGALDPVEAARILFDVASAVAYAHDRKVIHRDLKPANVLLDREGHALVTDFGLARQLDEKERLTRTGEVMGTPAYMAPEQAFGHKHEVDERTDVYGLGAILYAALSGRQPFQAATAIETVMQVCQEEPEPIGKVPAALEAFVFRALAKDRAARPQSAVEFMRELEEALIARPPLPRGLVFGLVGVALVCVGVTTALAVSKLKRRSPDPDRTPARPGKLEEILRNETLDPTQRRALLELLGTTAFGEKKWSDAVAAYEEAAKLPPALPPETATRLLAARVLASSAWKESAARLKEHPPDELAREPLAAACAHLYDLVLTLPGPARVEAIELLDGLPPGARNAEAVGKLCLTESRLAMDRWFEKVQKFKEEARRAQSNDVREQGMIALLGELKPTITRLGRAHDANPAIGPFPPELETMFGFVRYLGSFEARDPKFAPMWAQAFARAPWHPTYLYFQALMAIGTPGTVPHPEAAVPFCVRALPELEKCPDRTSFAFRALVDDFVSGALVQIAGSNLPGQSALAARFAPLTDFPDTPEAVRLLEAFDKAPPGSAAAASTLWALNEFNHTILEGRRASLINIFAIESLIPEFTRALPPPTPLPPPGGH